MSILKDFQLDLPEDLPRRRQFAAETRCVTAFFERVFERFQTEDCWRIIVECVAHACNSEVACHFSGIYMVRIHANVDQFFAAAPKDKKVWTLDTLMSGINVFIASRHWDRTLFDQAAQTIVGEGYRNHWFWKKSQLSPCKCFIGKVLCEHEVTSMDIWLVVQDKAGRVVGRKKVLSADPQELGYARHLGRAEWTDDREFSLINQNGDQRWFISISEITK